MWEGGTWWRQQPGSLADRGFQAGGQAWVSALAQPPASRVVLSKVMKVACFLVSHLTLHLRATVRTQRDLKAQSMLVLIEGRTSDSKCIGEQRERERIGESLGDEGWSCVWHQNQRDLGGGGIRS